MAHWQRHLLNSNSRETQRYIFAPTAPTDQSAVQWIYLKKNAEVIEIETHFFSEEIAQKFQKAILMKDWDAPKSPQKSFKFFAKNVEQIIHYLQVLFSELESSESKLESESISAVMTEILMILEPKPKPKPPIQIQKSTNKKQGQNNQDNIDNLDNIEIEQLTPPNSPTLKVAPPSPKSRRSPIPWLSGDTLPQSKAGGSTGSPGSPSSSKSAAANFFKSIFEPSRSSASSPAPASSSQKAP
jgi:hypothetical protein